MLDLDSYNQLRMIFGVFSFDQGTSAGAGECLAGIKISLGITLSLTRVSLFEPRMGIILGIVFEGYRE
jgi:hypothetical protein